MSAHSDGHGPGRADGLPVDQRVIDVHAHAMPLPLLTYLEQRGLADLSRLDSGTVLIDPNVSGIREGIPIPCPAQQYDMEKRLATLDGSRVDLALLSAPPFLMCTTDMDEQLTIDVVRRGNEELSTLAAVAPERLQVLGTVPVGHPRAVEEAHRCLDELHFAGVAVGSYGAGRELDDLVNEPLWEFLSDRHAIVFVHPSRVSDPVRLDAYHLPQLIGYPAETALAVSRLLLSGVFERHALTLVLAHGGGCLLSVGARLDLGWERKDVTKTTKRPPSHVLRELFFDTAVFDSTALRRLVEDVGADHVLLGTDAPFDLSERDPLGLLADADLDSHQRSLIAGGNAERLLRAALDGRGVQDSVAGVQ